MGAMKLLGVGMVAAGGVIVLGIEIDPLFGVGLMLWIAGVMILIDRRVR